VWCQKPVSEWGGGGGGPWGVGGQQRPDQVKVKTENAPPGSAEGGAHARVGGGRGFGSHPATKEKRKEGGHVRDLDHQGKA